MPPFVSRSYARVYQNVLQTNDATFETRIEVCFSPVYLRLCSPTEFKALHELLPPPAPYNEAKLSTIL